MIDSFRFFSRNGIQAVVIIACLVWGLAGCDASNPRSTPVIENSLPPATSTFAPLQETLTAQMANDKEAVLDKTFKKFLAQPVDEFIISQGDFKKELTHGDIFILDVRSPLEVRKAGFIKGEVLIPLRELGRKTSLLPDFEDPVVVFADDDWRCFIAVVGLNVFGWGVRCLAGGFEQWVLEDNEILFGELPVPAFDPSRPAFPCCFVGAGNVGAGFDPTQVANLSIPDPLLYAAVNEMFNHLPDDWGKINATELTSTLQSAQNLVLIDVRTDVEHQEYAPLSAHSSIGIPFDDLITMKSYWPADKTTPILVYSDNNYRSVLAMTILWIYGYDHVSALADGIDSIESPPGAFSP